MKLLKNFTTTILTIIGTIGGMCTTAGAYDYIMEYDVNMDNAVNIRDVVYINRILMGQGIASNPEFLDVNGNGIADEVDSKMILYYITGKSVYYNQQ